MAKLKTIDAIRTSTQAIKRYVDQGLNKKQDKLTYKKEDTAKTHKLEINGRQEDTLVEGTMPCYIFDLVGLVPDRYYTVKMKLHEIPEPSSLISEGEPVKLYDMPMNINANESSFEIDYENNFFIYKLPVTILSREITGFSVDVLLLTTEEENFSAPSIDFIIFDKLMYDENNLPYFLEDKSFFSVGNEYFSSLIEYVEIIPSEDFEVNDEFLETHRFVTLEEKEAINNMTMTQAEFDSIVSDLFGFEKKVFTFTDCSTSYIYSFGEPKDAYNISCKVYYIDGSIENKQVVQMGDLESNEYSYYMSISSDNGGISANIGNVNENRDWQIYIDYGGVDDNFPSNIVKVEVIIEL